MNKKIELYLTKDQNGYINVFDKKPLLSMSVKNFSDLNYLHLPHDTTINDKQKDAQLIFGNDFIELVTKQNQFRYLDLLNMNKGECYKITFDKTKESDVIYLMNKFNILTNEKGQEKLFCIELRDKNLSAILCHSKDDNHIYSLVKDNANDQYTEYSVTIDYLILSLTPFTLDSLQYIKNGEENNIWYKRMGYVLNENILNLNNCGCDFIYKQLNKSNMETSNVDGCIDKIIIYDKKNNNVCVESVMNSNNLDCDEVGNKIPSLKPIGAGKIYLACDHTSTIHIYLHRPVKFKEETGEIIFKSGLKCCVGDEREEEVKLTIIPEMRSSFECIFPIINNIKPGEILEYNIGSVKLEDEDEIGQYLLNCDFKIHEHYSTNNQGKCDYYYVKGNFGLLKSYFGNDIVYTFHYNTIVGDCFGQTVIKDIDHLQKLYYHITKHDIDTSIEETTGKYKM